MGRKQKNFFGSQGGRAGQPKIKKGQVESLPSIRSRQLKEISRLRGMRDILPEEYRYSEYVIARAERICVQYGFAKTELPVLEQQALYERSTGKQSDVVSKEMYTFIDKDGDKVALRPEATPGLVRSYVEHGLFNLPMQPVRLLWTGNLFRREKPQAGRYRQFTQVDVEMFGEATPVADA